MRFASLLAGVLLSTEKWRTLVTNAKLKVEQ